MASKFQAKIIQQYERDGWTVIKIIKLSDSGYPDLLCLKDGEIDHWVECKESNDTLKELQKFRINQLNKLGKKAFCIQNKKGIIYPTK